MGSGRFVLCVFILLASARLKAQLSDSLNLRPVEIIDNRTPGQTPGLSVIPIQAADPLQAGYSLAELLSRNTPFFVRQNGPGNLASPAFRGTAASHTAIIWNGFNLQSSMNGQLDLNLIPAFLFESFNVQPGANSGAWGSGAIGGAIFLGSDASGTSIGFQQQNGSGHSHRSAFKASISGKHLSFSVKAFRQEALNDFLFYNTALQDRPLQHQSNASQHQQGILSDLKILSGKSSYFLISAWLQEAERHIPPTLGVPVSKAFQTDKVQKYTASWNWNPGNFLLRLRSGIFKEVILFNDSLSNLDTYNRATTFVQEAELGYRISQHQRLQAGINVTDSYADADGFNKQLTQQQRRAVFASWKSSFFKEKLNLLVFARQEWLKTTRLPFTPSVSGSFKMSKQWLLRFQAAGVYRIPTLNDLYWVPGGNPNLKAEHGHSFELGVDWKKEIGNLSLHANATVFSNLINDWILWIPGAGYWSPQNVQKVHSRGLEQSAGFCLKTGRIIWKFNSALQLVKSTAIESYGNSGIQVGKQLLYVPLVNWNQFIGVSYCGWSIDIRGTLIGNRFTTSDNTESLPGCYVLNQSLSKQLHFRQNRATCFLQLNNLLNQDYQLTLGRPMPLLTWQTGISFEFNP